MLKFWNVIMCTYLVCVLNEETYFRNKEKSVIGSVKYVEVFFLFPGNTVVISYCTLSWKVNQNYCHERCGYKICKYFPVSVALLVRPSVIKKNLQVKLKANHIQNRVSQNIGKSLPIRKSTFCQKVTVH
jgi:hypothetical protein